MEKKIFSYVYMATSLFVMIFCLIGASVHGSLLGLVGDASEKSLESCFPAGGRVKELYGTVGKVITPVEIGKDNTVFLKDEDGYLLPVIRYSGFDTNLAVKKLKEMSDFCEDIWIPFVYVSYPSKIDTVDYSSEYGVYTNSEDIRTSLLNGLIDSNVNVLNVRNMLEADGYKRKDIFYKTDHHWNTRKSSIMSTI